MYLGIAEEVGSIIIIIIIIVGNHSNVWRCYITHNFST